MHNYFLQASKKFSRLHLVTFSRNDLQFGLDYIKQHAHLQTEDSNDKEPQLIYSTGVGCTEFGKLICQTLNVR
jgi:hypothetical protein